MKKFRPLLGVSPTKILELFDNFNYEKITKHEKWPNEHAHYLPQCIMGLPSDKDFEQVD